MVVVLVNCGGQRQAQIVPERRQLELNLPPDSLFTLRWNPNAWTRHYRRIGETLGGTFL
jgi:hypothetical protein